MPTRRRSKKFPQISGIIRGKFWPFVFFAAITLVSLFILHKVYRESTIAANKPEHIPSGNFIHWTSTIDQPHAMVDESSISISGTANDSIILVLKVNGKLTAVTLASGGKFNFHDVQLEYGANELSVLSMTINGDVQQLLSTTVAYGPALPSYLAREVSRGNLRRKQLALTFDGGSGDGCAEEIIKILKEKNVQATFFITGAFIKRYPELVKQIAQNGFEIGNHTWSHPHLTTFAVNRTHQTHAEITKEKLQRELRRTAEAFKKLTGQEMAPLWRAPFGEHNEEIRSWAAELGYLEIGWTTGGGQTMDTLDWVADTTSTHYYSAQDILQRLLRFGQESETGANGSIILMHLDTQRKSDSAYTILPSFIDSMNARGYSFASISDIMHP